MDKDFLKDFGKYADEILIGVKEVAALLRTSPAAVYKRLERGIAPPPCVSTGNQIRFRVGDVRNWLRSLQVAETEERASKNIGRPRMQFETRRPSRPTKEEELRHASKGNQS